MTTNSELTAVVPSTRPAIETIDQAATELRRLYELFNNTAIDLTSDYLKERLDGEEGVTWAMFPRVGFLGRPTAILDDVMRHRDGRIILGPGYNMHRDLLMDYCLKKTPMLLPNKNGTFTKFDAINIRRVGRGYDPGAEFIIVGPQIMMAGYDHHDTMPTVGSHGGLAWSVPRSFVGSTFSALTEMHKELDDALKGLRSFAREETQS